MPFVKQNLVSIIAVALAIVGIPVMVYFSSGWQADNRKTLEDGVSQTMRTLNGANVQYEAAVPGPDGQPYNLNTTPSQRRNDRMREVREALVRRSSSVRDAIIALNRAGKTLLVSGDARYGDLFPAPASESARVALLTRMMDAYPEAHEKMLEGAGVRGAPNEEAIRSQVEAQQTRRIASITSQRVDQTLSEDEVAELREFLGQYRADLYREHARGTTIFGTPDVFVGLERLDPENGDPIVPLERAWEWQHRTWFNQDLIAALEKANTDSAGNRQNVLQGPVKRIMSIAIEELPQVLNQNAGRDGGDGGGGGTGGGSLNAPIPPDYSVSHTGLNAWPTRPNPLYDLRYATVTLIASGERVPEIVEAISTTNIMNVVDLDIREYNGAADLSNGFDYGAGQTVVLTLRVESAWIREWMKTDMPPQVRTRLGIPDDPQPAAETADAG